jgi:hypothetical protein
MLGNVWSMRAFVLLGSQGMGWLVLAHGDLIISS